MADNSAVASERIAVSVGVGRPCLLGELSVLSLLFSGSPATILRGVSRGVIDAFDGVAIPGPFAHVSEKLNERHPSLANRDTSPSVSIIAGVVGIQTTIFHALPRTVSGGRRLSEGCVPVFGYSLSLQTTARQGLSGDKVVGMLGAKGATGTQAYPSTFVSLLGGNADNRESAECSPEQIQSLHMMRSSAMIVSGDGGKSNQ